MRRLPRFKIYNQCKGFNYNCPSKFLKFKHSKWKRYVSFVQKNLRRKAFFDFSLISPKMKSWEKQTTKYKSQLIFKRNLLQTFDSSIHFKNCKMSKKKLKLDRLSFAQNLLLQFEYRIDILLTRLLLFSSVYDARKNIFQGSVLVNAKRVSSNYNLKKGDIININKTINNILINKSQLKVLSYLSFIEIDIYTSTFVIIKDFNEIGYIDFSLLFYQYFNFSKLYLNLYKN